MKDELPTTGDSSLPDCCPLCSTSIELTAEHLGCKVRCQNCGSKFLVSEQSGRALELLERGSKVIRDAAESSKGVNLTSATEPKARLARASGPLVARHSSPSLGTKHELSRGVMVGVIALSVMLAILGLVLLSNKEPRRSELTATALDVTPDLELEDTESGLQAREPLEKDSESSIQLATTDIEHGALVEKEPEMAEIAMVKEEKLPELQEEAPPVLNDAQRANALVAIQSGTASRRLKLYKAMRGFGEAGHEVYLELLEAARDHHLKELSKSALKLTHSRGPLGEFVGAYAQWELARDKAKSLVKTHWKNAEPGNYQQRHREMDDAFNSAEKAFEKMQRAVRKAASQSERSLSGPLEALAEIEREEAWCNARSMSSLPSVLDLLREADLAPDYVDSKRALLAVQRATELRRKVAEFNSSCRWARGAKQVFAVILNDRRVILGQMPLRLDEALSLGCLGHSEDMGKNNYFSHTGLTPETQTFSIRAKRAGFQGAPTGECIFKGSPAAEAAHRAWWYSDGHRLIMYADGPNTLGLGVSGGIWTLNTGRMNHEVFR